MTGNDFLKALKAVVAPETIVDSRGTADGVIFRLSDGRSFTVERKRIVDLRTDDDTAAYLKQVLA